MEEYMELKIPDPMLQKHLEAFQVALSKKQTDDLVESVYRRILLETAIEMEWLEDCDLKEKSAVEVYELGGAIQDKIREIMYPPKN
jgi:hypothetical protein